ncbi:hypothetical protein A2U01_0001058 [Trifolium medium]|uniref:Uncharacterized protein n=1 Tax=Trifolium medium TaxID=97028 RepID=A0A392LZ37_9FABA|nr:hypothetical protein [Trifolium medium]
MSAQRALSVYTRAGQITLNNDQCTEDDWHVLFTCNDSLQVRQAAGLDQTITGRVQQLRNAKEVIHAICAGYRAQIWESKHDNYGWSGFRFSNSSMLICIQCNNSRV